MSKKKFINSYNFIPFGYIVENQRTSRETVYRGSNSLMSGWLTVKLDTKTPVIIPDGAHPKYFDLQRKCYVKNPDEEEQKKLHKEYSFLRIPSSEESEDKNNTLEPVIPGSELRGMLRSVYEAVTDSCIPFLLDDKPISQRVPTFGSLQKRGLLAYERISTDSEERRWVLYSTYADKEEVTVSRDGKLFLADGSGRVHEKNGTYVEGRGWLQYNIPVVKMEKGEKKIYHIAYLNKNDVVFTWDYYDENGRPDKERNEEPYKAMRSVLYKYGKRDDNQIPKQNLKAALESAKEGNDNLVPVYYFTVKRGDETLVYLSNSSIGRIAQRRKWREIMGVHAPCDSTEKLCPACLLFGTVKGKGLKGHIRVTDAVQIPGSELRYETHTLQVLGEPRTSAFEFYLRKPEGTSATYWNFDFYGKKVWDKNDNPHTEYHDLGEATPRGRKMYWHSPIAPDAGKDRMNATMEAVNGSFEFKVYFDEVTEEQLQNLIWVITLGENNVNSTKQHKIGHAKPLGYGSIKMTVTEKVIRKLEVADGELSVVLDRSFVEQKVEHKLKDTDVMINNLLKMCDTTTITADTPVMYPKEINRKGDEAIFTWFAENRKNADRLKTLPEPTDRVLTLMGDWKTEVPVVQDGNKPKYAAGKSNGRIDFSKLIGTTQSVKVTGMNKSGKFVYFKLNDGSNGSAYANNRRYASGDSLKVRIKDYKKDYSSYGAEIVGE